MSTHLARMHLCTLLYTRLYARLHTCLCTCSVRSHNRRQVPKRCGPGLVYPFKTCLVVPRACVHAHACAVHACPCGVVVPGTSWSAGNGNLKTKRTDVCTDVHTYVSTHMHTHMHTHTCTTHVCAQVHQVLDEGIADLAVDILGTALALAWRHS